MKILVLFITLILTSCSDSYDINSLNIKGTPAQITTIDNFNPESPTNVVIYLPGNSRKYTTLPDSPYLDFILSKNYIYCSIQIQDEYKPPFTNNNTGWGNEVALQRVIDLHDYLAKNYNIQKVILIGESMGGLTMGQILCNNIFHVDKAIGIGPVPSLEKIFNNAENRRIPIRNAWKLNHDGSNDNQINNINKQYDWFNLLDNINHNLPETYIYYGTDNVVTKDFGGIEVYEQLIKKLEKKSPKVILKTNNSDSHVHKTLIGLAIKDSIF